MFKIGIGVLIGIAVSATGILVYNAVETQHGPSAADRRLAAAKVVAAATEPPSSCCRRALSTTCTATPWSVCLVTVYVPEPLDGCEDWAISLHHHFATGPRYLETWACRP